MKTATRALATVTAFLLAGCAVPDWYRSGGDVERPPAEAGRPSAISEGVPPAEPHVAVGSPDGWDAAPPAGTSTAGDPLAHPMPPPPPAPLEPSTTAGAPPAEPPPLAPGAMAAGTSDSDPLYYSFTGKEPPDLAADGAWLTPAAAPTLATLKGQVVFLFFAFQGCPSCVSMTPYLQQWNQMFGPMGLAVVYVNNGLMANEDAARKAIVAESLAFPYFHDAKGETLRRFGVRSFPTAYLIDRQGKVVWEGAPLAIEPQIQAKIVELLK